MLRRIAAGFPMLMAIVLARSLPSLSHARPRVEPHGGAQGRGPAEEAVETLPSSGTLGSLLDAGATALSQGRFAEAEARYSSCVEIARESKGAESQHSRALFGLAYSLSFQDRHAAALTLAQRALEIDEKSFGSDHPGVAQSLSKLAWLHYNHGELTAAESLYRRSLAIRERDLGTDHPDVAQILNNLAAICLAQGRPDAAEPLARPSLTIVEKALGPEHPAVGANLTTLAEICQGGGRFEEAASLYERALRLADKASGSEHPTTVIVLQRYAALLRRTPHDAEARALEERAESIRARMKQRMSQADRA
jgi:tetratricopeptide (TPR) repeat protein